MRSVDKRLPPAETTVSGQLELPAIRLTRQLELPIRSVDKRLPPAETTVSGQLELPAIRLTRQLELPMRSVDKRLPPAETTVSGQLELPVIRLTLRRSRELGSPAISVHPLVFSYTCEPSTPDSADSHNPLNLRYLPVLDLGQLHGNCGRAEN